MLEKTVVMGNIQFTVFTETGNEVVSKRILHSRFYNSDNNEWQKWFIFIRLLVQSKDVITPFPWPKITDSDQELTAARDALFCLNGKVIRAWDSAIDEVDMAPISDADLLPPDMLPTKKNENLTLLPSVLSSEAQ